MLASCTPSSRPTPGPVWPPPSPGDPSWTRSTSTGNGSSCWCPWALGIAVTYRGVRVNTFEKYWIKTLILTVQIVLAMILLGAASYLFIQFAVPYLLPMPD